MSRGFCLRFFGFGSEEKKRLLLDGIFCKLSELLDLFCKLSELFFCSLNLPINKIQFQIYSNHFISIEVKSILINFSSNEWVNIFSLKSLVVQKVRYWNATTKVDVRELLYNYSFGMWSTCQPIETHEANKVSWKILLLYGTKQDYTRIFNNKHI